MLADIYMFIIINFQGGHLHIETLAYLLFYVDCSDMLFEAVKYKS